MEIAQAAAAAPKAPSDAQPAPLSSNGEEQQTSKQAADDTKDEATNDQLVAQIVKQVNFYFSDANLPTDAFLLKEVQKNPEGWGKLVMQFICNASPMSWLTNC